MKFPTIARLHELKSQTENLKGLVKEVKQKLKARSEELDSLYPKYSEGWTEFTKKCVKIAELNQTIRKQSEMVKEFQAECSKLVKVSQQGLPATDLNLNSMSQSYATSRLMMTTDQRVMKTGSAVVPISRSKRPSSFQQMDRILKRHDNWPYSLTKTPKSNLNSISDVAMPPSPTVNTTSNQRAPSIAELRSRIRSQIMINPMPQYLGSPRVNVSASTIVSQVSSFHNKYRFNIFSS